MPWSTSSLFGSNSRPLSFANPIVAHLAGAPRPCIVVAVDTSGPTAVLYGDIDAGAGVLAVFGAGLPHDDAATGEDDMLPGKWICIKAPPVR